MNTYYYSKLRTTCSIRIHLEQCKLSKNKITYIIILNQNKYLSYTRTNKKIEDKKYSEIDPFLLTADFIVLTSSPDSTKFSKFPRFTSQISPDKREIGANFISALKLNIWKGPLF